MSSILAAPPGVSAETDALLQEWVQWMRAGRMSARTINDSPGVIRLLERRLGIPIATCSSQQLAALFDDLADTVSAGTTVTYFGRLRSWYRWLTIMDYRLDNPTVRMHPPKTPRRRPRPITIHQLQQILASDRFYGRTRTMVLLAAYAGLRVHEIAKVRGEDFTSAGLVVAGKGGRTDLIPIHPVIEAERRHYPAAGWWFPSYVPTEHGHVVPRSVSTVISQAMRRAGVDATAHQLRHWFGTQVLRTSGGNLRVAQELLRHASPATTAMYTQVDDEERRAALVAL